MAKIEMRGLVGSLGDYESTVVPVPGDTIVVKRKGEELGRFRVDSRVVEHEVDAVGNVVDENWNIHVTVL